MLLALLMPMQMMLVFVQSLALIVDLLVVLMLPVLLVSQHPLVDDLLRLCLMLLLALVHLVMDDVRYRKVFSSDHLAVLQRSLLEGLAVILLLLLELFLLLQALLQLQLLLLNSDLNQVMWLRLL